MTRFVNTLALTLVGTVLLVPVLTIALAAAGEEVNFIERSPFGRTSAWLAVSPEGPPPTPEDVREYAVRYCRAAGVEGLAREFYTPSIAAAAAREYAEQGTEGRPYLEAAFGGCLEGLTSANRSE